MYSPRQRDLRERRIHQRIDEHGFGDEAATADVDEGSEFEASSPWGVQLSASAA